MLGQSNPKKKVAAFSSTRARFTLTAQTDALAFADAARNRDLILFLFVRTGASQRHRSRRAVQRFLERDHNVGFYIGAAFGCRSAPAESAERRTAAPTTKKRFEKIAESCSTE